MASRRIAASTIDWAAFASRVPNEQLPQFRAFKAKSDEFARHIINKPEALPKINWDQYEKRIPIAGMVQEFKKQYEGLKISYPEDNYSEAITIKEKQAMEDVKKFIEGSEARIAKIKDDLKFWENMIPFDEMTMEQYHEYFPDQSINLDKPTFWPHTPEVQPGYVAEGEEEEHH